MKRLLIIAALVVAPSAYAADLVCTVPAAAVSRAVELCEELRVSLHVRTADWSNDACASEFLRIGLKQGERASTQRSSQATVAQVVNDAIDTFDTNWPRATAAACGDGTLDTEFGEACDDGNRTPGDGCDEFCQIEP